jgi:hypothetical protein
LRPQQKPIALFPELRSEQPAYEWLSAVARAAPMTAAADVALIDAAPTGTIPDHRPCRMATFVAMV